MRKIALIAAVLLLVASKIPCQTVPVTATMLSDSALNPANGTLTFSPVNSAGQPIAYKKGGGGQATAAPVNVTVKNGAFTINLADVSQTSPAWICFSLALAGYNGAALGPGYTCVQPHSAPSGPTDWCQVGGCNFDNYIPKLADMTALTVPAAKTTLPGTVVLMASKLSDSSGNPATGTISFQPTANGVPIAFRKGSGGQADTLAVTTTVTNGAFSLPIADTTLTNPANVCFAAKFAGYNGAILGNGFSCLQPHAIATGAGDWCQAGVCNLDNYIPNLPNLAPVVGVTTINLTSGAITFTGPGFTQSGTSFYFNGGAVPTAGIAVSDGLTWQDSLPLDDVQLPGDLTVAGALQSNSLSTGTITSGDVNSSGKVTSSSMKVNGASSLDGTTTFGATPVMPSSSASCTGGTCTFDGSSATTFNVTLSQTVTSSSFTGGQSGVVYTFVWTQNATGGYGCLYPSGTIGASPCFLKPNGRTTQTFMWNSTYLKSMAAAVYE